MNNSGNNVPLVGVQSFCIFLIEILITIYLNHAIDPIA
jgi:hypothetical protein